MSHESRLRCVLLLFVHDGLCVCDLTEVLGEAQPNVSRHLAQLRTLGLVSDRREGQWIHYRFNRAVPTWVTAILQAVADEVRDRAPYSRDIRAIGRIAGRADRERCR